MLLALLACSAPADDSGQPPAPYDSPDEVGPWHAGTFESTFLSTTGLELTVQVWYPTQTSEDALADYDDLFIDTALESPTPDCAAPRPVMMVSHGSGGLRYQSTYWTEFLATHGWVVVAPDHPYSTFFDEDDSKLIEIAMRRPIDIRDSYDWLLDTAADGRLQGCLDPDAGYAMSGHSFGAYTTLAVTGTVLDLAASVTHCETTPDWLCDDLVAWLAEHPDVTEVDGTDPRATSGIPMAPAGYELLVGGLPENTSPMLVWGGTRDTLTPINTQVRPIYEDLGGQPANLALLTDAGHYNFSNACELAPIFEDCFPPFLADDVAHPIIRATSLAFLQSLAGETRAAPWLPPDEPLVTWESR